MIVFSERKLIFSFLLLGLILAPVFFISAQGQKQIEINFFYGEFCPHCAKEEEFLNGLEAKYPELKIKKFEISERENSERTAGF